MIRLYSMCLRCRRWLSWVLILTFIFHIIQYILDARGRIDAGKPPHHWLVTTATVKGVSYTAKSAFVHGDTVVIRLYRTDDSDLLAERMYVEHGVDLFWGTDRLIYDTSDDSFLGGAIQLPPTRLDNFLAKLP